LTNDIEGYPKEKLEGAMRRQYFYAKQMGGVPSNHSQTFEKKGWIMPYIYSTEYIFWGRYDYWHHILDEVYTIEEAGPIPQITWCEDKKIIRNVQAMLSDCVNYGIRYGCTLDDFAEWILWGMDATDKHPEIPMEVNERWYRTFACDLMLKFPNDYMTWLLIEWYSLNVTEEREVSAEVIDFEQLTRNMEAEFEGKNPEELKRMTVYEEEAGCGRSLIVHSNYTLFAEGRVEDPLAMKLNKIQMMLYAPWYAYNPFRQQNGMREMLNEVMSLLSERENKGIEQE
jgi:hypothetical protein